MKQLRPLLFLVPLNDFDLLLEVFLQTEVVLPESVVFFLDFEMQLDFLIRVSMAGCVLELLRQPLGFGFKPPVGFTKLLETLDSLRHFLLTLQHLLLEALYFLLLVRVRLFNQLHVLLEVRHLLLGQVTVLLRVLRRLKQQLYLRLQVLVRLGFSLELLLYL